MREVSKVSKVVRQVLGARAGARNSVDVGGFLAVVSAVGMRFRSGEPVG